MPTYAYACTSCGHRFDIHQAFTDDALTECPECGGPLRKQFGNVGVVFKGSGFYRNDARGKTTTSESGGSSSKSSSETSGSKDSGSTSGGSKGSGSSSSSSSSGGSGSSGSSSSGSGSSGSSGSSTSKP